MLKPFIYRSLLSVVARGNINLTAHFIKKFFKKFELFQNYFFGSLQYSNEVKNYVKTLINNQNEEKVVPQNNHISAVTRSNALIHQRISEVNKY